MRLLEITLALALLLAVACAFRKQKVHAKGTLRCGSQPAGNVRVKLVDEDDGPDPDDELDSGYTDAQGRFNIQGSTRELTNIDPRLKIYHDCNDKGRPCQRKWKFEIPDHYINKGTFDLGEVNLEAEIDDEDRDCVH